MTDEQRWIRRAIDLATSNVADGGGPFGAVVVQRGDCLGVGVNRVTRDNDPTAHAEVVAIREACRAVNSFALTGCVLYTSCEPCPLCASAALWARMDAVVYAADRDDAARGGFDDREFHDLIGADRASWPMPVRIARVRDATAPFEAWLADADRRPY